MDTTHAYPYNDPPRTEQSDDTMQDVGRLVVLDQNNSLPSGSHIAAVYTPGTYMKYQSTDHTVAINKQYKLTELLTK